MKYIFVILLIVNNVYSDEIHRIKHHRLRVPTVTTHHRYKPIYARSVSSDTSTNKNVFRCYIPFNQLELKNGTIIATGCVTRVYKNELYITHSKGIQWVNYDDITTNCQSFFQKYIPKQLLFVKVKIKPNEKHNISDPFDFFDMPLVEDVSTPKAKTTILKRYPKEIKANKHSLITLDEINNLQQQFHNQLNK